MNHLRLFLLLRILDMSILQTWSVTLRTAHLPNRYKNKQTIFVLQQILEKIVQIGKNGQCSIHKIRYFVADKYHVNMVVDYKKEYKDLYLPKITPTIVDVPAMQSVAVEGRGNPNDEDGEYQQAIVVLYGIQYTIKMSKKGNFAPVDYFDSVVPPLEGFWWLDSNEVFSCENKSNYCWLSLMRLPEFVDLRSTPKPHVVICRFF